MQLTHYRLDIKDHEHPIITTIQIPQDHEQRIITTMLPMIISIQIPHMLHQEGKLFESRGCLVLVRRYYIRSSEFTIFEMRKGCSVWSIKYIVNTDDFMNPLHEGWSIRSIVSSIVLGEKEEDSFLVINLSAKVVQYNLISKTLFYDMGSNEVADDYLHGFIPPYAMYDVGYKYLIIRSNNPDKERRQGRCPLTPEEVSLMLRALGYSKDLHLYVASGEVYGGDDTLAPLRALFPNIHSKDTIATKDDLEPFSTFSSRMAALDFIVCDESDVFVTNNNGNMAKILAGDTLDTNQQYDQIMLKTTPFVPKSGKHNMGRVIFKKAKSRSETLPRKFGKDNIDSDEVVTDQDIENQPEVSDQDEDDDLMGPQFLQSANETNVDDDPSISELPELEELLSD
ncbi:GDP-fucose protein O-fucosyltransferase [Tanacetum coccineum]